MSAFDSNQPKADVFFLSHCDMHFALDFDLERSVCRAMLAITKASKQAVLPESIKAEIARLSDLPIAGLRTIWRAEFRRYPPKGIWRDLLVRTLAWRLQEKALGGHDKATAKLLTSYGRRVPEERGYQRLKAGTVLIRDFEGARHTVTIVPGGFIWREKTYGSLSAIAKLITGTNWNGPRFFGLRAGSAHPAPRQETAA
jgi:hypothetical protein